jgi:copper homeostasis protein (lipoprotein)
MFLAIAATLAPFYAFGGELTGTASYRERIALPSEAAFQAILYDISDNDQVEIGRFESTGDAGPPYRFVIEYADEDVGQDGLYAITTQVIWPDRAFFLAGTRLVGFPAVMPEIDLVMVRPGVSPAATPLETTELPMPMIGAHGLALPATYQGVVQGNAGAEAWSLALATDQTFLLSRSFESSERDSLGRWVADPTTGTLVLRDGAEMPLLVRPSASGALRVVDGNTGKEFVGDLTLAEDEALELSGMMMGGMMTYMADAAIFEDCVSGAVFPLAQEGDYLALEQAYLADRAEPGAPLYVTLEGGLALRPAMEGPDRQMIVVDRFIRTRPEIACAQQRADASLQNTYWRLDTLDGEAFSMQATQREPHIVLEAGESGAYRAMVGCNRMRGGYTNDGNALSFSPAAATMMVCPAPLDAIEGRFGEVMADVAGYAIEGKTLVLRNTDGDPLAIFTAVYF